MNIDRKERDEARWTKVMVGLMLLALSMSIVALGAVGIVSIANNDPVLTSPSTSPSETEVQVQLSDFAITMVPAVVPPGKVKFTINNGGAMPHDFVLPDLGKQSPLINAGETAVLVVDIPNEGTYKVVCTVAGHEASGMVSSLTVSAEASSTAAAPDHGQPEMSWQEMDAMMTETAKKFPAATSGTGNSMLEYTMSADGFKEFHLTAKIIDWEVEPGKFVKGWTYNGEIPGPIIQVNVGDKVRIVHKNELSESTALHLHGIRIPNSMDGVPPYTQDPIPPGGTFVYEFTAQEIGVGMYHPHHNAQVQLSNGMAGALLIGDWKSLAMKAAGNRMPDKDGKAEQEVMMVLHDSGTIGLALNGKSFPATTPYKLKVGESMVVHYFNEGAMAHPMHLHESAGLVVARDGKLLEVPFLMDTLNVAPGERWTVVYTAQSPGVWAWHCHILSHVDTPKGMRYMVTALIVDPA